MTRAAGAHPRDRSTVPFAYPRDESLHETREFGELRSHIRELVMKEYAAQARAGARDVDRTGRNPHVNHRRRNTMRRTRRQFLQTAAAIGVGAGIGMPARRRSRRRAPR